MWFLVGPPTCLFPCKVRGLAHRPSPNRTDTPRFSLPSGKLFCRVPSIQSLPLRFRARQLPTWVSALFSTSSHSSQSQTFQVLLALSPALSTVRQLLQCDLRAYFIPQPSSGHLLVQGFVHFEQLSVFIRPNFAPMPLSSRTLTCKQAAAHERFDFDALLHTKSRTDRFGS